MGIPQDPRQKHLSERLGRLLEQARTESPGVRDALMAMHTLALADKPALTRTCYEPGHFTASAFVLSPDKQSLLLIFHKKLRKWLQPGGHVEPEDRDLIFAARREVEEETGLRDLQIEQSYFDFDVHLIPAFGDCPEHLHHDVRCLFVAGTLAVQASDEVSEARWFRLSEVSDSPEHLADGYGTDESVRRVARRLAEMHCR